MKRDRVVVGNFKRPVSRDILKILEEMVEHSHIESVNPLNLIPSRSSRENGIKIRDLGMIDRQVKSLELKLTFYSRAGRQEVYITINPKNYLEVRNYIENLSKKYFS